MVWFKAPDGTEIKGTVEEIPGVAGVFWDEKSGSAVADYQATGDTEACWDGQTTRAINGAPVFQAVGGLDWLQHHLIPEGIEPLSNETCAAMRQEILVGDAIRAAELLSTALDHLVADNLFVRGGEVDSMLEDLRPLYLLLGARAGDLKLRDLARVPA